MHSENRVRTVVAMLATATVVVLLAFGPTSWMPTKTLSNILLGATLVGLIVVADFFAIELPLSSVHLEVSVSSAFCFAAALCFGPLLGALVAGFGGLIIEIVQRRAPIKLLMNVTAYTLSTFLAGAVYTSLANTSISPVHSVQNAGVMLLATAAYVLSSSGMMSLAISQAVGVSPWRMWQASALGVLLESVALPTLGALIPTLKAEGPLALIIAVIPLLGPYLAFRSYRQIDKETRNTIELLADLLDRRDPYTSEHSKRVANYSRGILEQLDHVPVEETEMIVSAARIHDLGKVSTHDGILTKPDELTPEETLAIQQHSAEGADIIANLAMYRRAAALVRHHHERWDGQGYPDKLAGTDIPFGARVIAVADSYDAMTSERVYRGALPHHVAMSEIRRGTGTQFDPEIVAAFERSMDAASRAVPAQRICAAHMQTD